MGACSASQNVQIARGRLLEKRICTRFCAYRCLLVGVAVLAPMFSQFDISHPFFFYANI
jgi:hypothetical protein